MKHLYFFTFLLACMLFSSVSAQQIRIDSTYGDNGIVQVGFPGYSSSGQTGTIQPDGKILEGGWLRQDTTPDDSYGVVRTNLDGSLDESFGTGGKVTGNLGIEFCTDIKVQSDGKIIVSGRSYHPVIHNSQPGLIRLHDDGSLDLNFGNNGLAISNFAGDHVFGGRVLIQPDDKILVAAYHLKGNDDDLTLTRYKSDGTPDNTFSGDGNMFVDMSSGIGQSEDSSIDLAIQSDGKAIIAGISSFSDSVGFYNTLARVTTNGFIDATFGVVPGKVVWKTPVNNYLMRSMKVLPDNKILCLLSNESHPDIVLAKFNSNGTPDLSFGTNGMSVYKNTFDASIKLKPLHLGILGQGIFVTGDCRSSVFKDGWFISKFNAEGNIDTTFGQKGVYIPPFYSANGYFTNRKLEISPDSKAILFGQIYASSGFDFLIMRIITDLNVGVIDHQTAAENTLIYPNPIHNRSTLKYTLNSRQKVSISLINSTGQTVTVFKDQENQDPGEYQIPLEFPYILPPGVYFINIRTETGSTTVKTMKN